MRHSLNKVLLTVSPFRSSFLPRFRVYSRNRLFLPSYAPRGANISPALSTLRILPVATGVYRIPSAVRRSLSPPPSPLESTLTKVYQNKRLQLPLESPLMKNQEGGGVIVNWPRRFLRVLCAPVSVPSVLRFFCPSGLQYTLRPGSSQQPAFAQPSWTNA